MTEETPNQQRGTYAAEVIAGSEHYAADDPGGVQDLLSDLMHLCRTKDWNFSEILRVATDNFNAEVMDAVLESQPA